MLPRRGCYYCGGITRVKLCKLLSHALRQAIYHLALVKRAALFKFSLICDTSLVKISITHLLLAICVAISLSLSLLPVSAAGGKTDAGEMVAMADEMPGCPGPMTPDECHKCPLMVVCLVKSVAGIPGDVLGAKVAYGQRLVLRPSNDALLAGLGFPPPARPPRTNVIPA